MLKLTTFNPNTIFELTKEFIALTKPRVNLLIMFTAIVGMLLAHNTTNINYALIFISSVGIGLAASAAAIINQVVDQKIDSIMDRTKTRPI